MEKIGLMIFLGINIIRYIYGEILDCTGPLSVEVKIEDGQILHYHQDHLRKRHCDAVPELVLKKM